MERNKILDFAINNGYSAISYLGKWRDYEIYEPIIKPNEESFVGLPLTIMVKGAEIRMSTPNEAMEQINNGGDSNGVATNVF